MISQPLTPEDELCENIERALGKLPRPTTFWQKTLYAAAREYEVNARIREQSRRVIEIIKQRDQQKEPSVLIGGKKVEFAHTAVNGDMHLFIDGYHNPVVCPECIQPGLLVTSVDSNVEKSSN
jgi:hypothetical protein